MGIKKRVSALLLAVLLSFGVCAVDYLKVDALEIGGSVVWDTAINYLLGLLGLSPIAENGDKIVDFDAIRSKWVQDYEAYFYANVKPEDLPEGYTKERAYQNWIDNVCRGNLNTIEYGAWDIFKKWAETLPSENSGGGSGGGSTSGSIVFGQTTVIDAVNILKENYNFRNLTYNGTADSVFYSFVVTGGGSLSSGSSLSGRVDFFSDTITFLKTTSSSSYTSDETPIRYVWVNGIKLGTSNSTNYYYGVSKEDFFNDFSIFSNNVVDLPSLLIDGNYNCAIFEYTENPSVPTTSDYAVVNDRISDLQIINDYSTTTTQNVVSIDWDKIGTMISDAVGTVTGSLDRTITDALDDAQEKVASGTMSVANYNDYVTEISNTYVYDITNETSITNPDSTVTGVVSGNVENAEFVLKGLQYVFPFCIPWDIKDFVTLLVADPVAPVIEYPIYNPVTDTDEIITIDFSLWENQVRIIRYIFDFLLIIGLLLLARSLIGAGGSD